MKFKDFLHEAKDMKTPKTIDEVFDWIARNDMWCQHAEDPRGHAEAVYVVDPKTLVITMQPEFYSGSPEYNDATNSKFIPSFANDEENQDLYTTLPVKFGKLHNMNFHKNNVTSFKNFPPIVETYFSITDNPLSSLVGCPEEVGNFHLTLIPISKLDALPKIIHEGLAIKECHQLTSLFGVEHITSNDIVLRLEDCKGITKLDYVPPNIQSLELYGMKIDDLSGLHKKAPNLSMITFWDNTVIKGSILSLLKYDDLLISEHNLSDPSFKKALEIVQKHQADKNIPECMDELIEAGLKEYAKL
jgi:hypothetical protein